MTDLQKLFGENVRHYRKQLKLTQAQLSEIIDVSPSFIGFIETGKTCPSFKTMEALSSALNVPPEKLFSPREKTERHAYIPQPGQDYEGHERLQTDYNPSVARFIHDLNQLISQYKDEATPPHKRRMAKQP